MRICSHCSSNEVENEIHFVFHCNLHEQLRKTLFNDIILKYPEFGSLNEQNKILFLFNNIDPYICKKLGYFIFEAFQKRKRKTWFYFNAINYCILSLLCIFLNVITTVLLFIFTYFLFCAIPSMYMGMQINCCCCCCCIEHCQ